MALSEEDNKNFFKQMVDRTVDERVGVLFDGFKATLIGILNRELEPIGKKVISIDLLSQYLKDEVEKLGGKHDDLRNKLDYLARRLVKSGVLKQERPQRQISSREVLDLGLAKVREYYGRVRTYLHKS